MGKTIYGPNNPNHDIFVVESEEGGDSDDNMSSMIGDATMAHLQSLSPSDRQCWEHYVLMGGKSLFDFVPSPGNTDRDPHGLKVEDIDNYYTNRPDLLKHKEWMDEVLEEERERRAKSEDVYHKSEMIPYADWEQNPGLMKHFDMPSTPKDLAIFCGNTTQRFYDEFPEGHPDEKIINDLLIKVNRDGDELTEKYGTWLKTWLGQQPINLPYTGEILDLLITRLVEGEKDPEDVTKIALTLLDSNWREQYMTTAKGKLAFDAVHQLMARKALEWDEEHEKGIDVLPSVKGFGQVLYSRFRKSIKRSHWSFYKSLKARYSPAVIVRGLDINNCRLGDLERILGIPRGIAVEIWVNRPFISTAELQRREVWERAVTAKAPDGTEIIIKPAKKMVKGWLNKELLEEKGSVEQLYELVRAKAREAQERRNLKVFSGLSQVLVDRQKEGKDRWSSKEWGALWNYYRSMKSDILSSIKDNRA